MFDKVGAHHPKQQYGQSMSDVKNLPVEKQASWRPGCFFGGFTGLLIALIAFLSVRFVPESFGPSKYESVARVMVVGKKATGLYLEGRDPNETIINRERNVARRDVEVIKSDFLIQQAMRIGELEKRPSFRRGRSILREALSVELEDELPIIKITVRLDQADDARAGADAVVLAFRAFVKKREDGKFDEVKFLITEALADVEHDL
ncbi:MAG: hypothetical protein AB8G99_19190, partial [Planctomycetaceae bacterium]